MPRRGGDGSGSRTLGTRIVGVALLDRAVIAGIEEDDFADFQAQQVVLMAAISTLIGLVIAGPGVGLAGALVIGIRWYVVSDVVERLGIRWHPEQAARFSRKRAMRVIGYAHGPLLLAFLTPIPALGPIVWIVINVWAMAAMAAGIGVILRGTPLSRYLWLLIGAALPAVIPLFFF